MGSNYSRDVFDSSCSGMLDHEKLAQIQNTFLTQLQNGSQQQPTTSAAGKRILESVEASSSTTKKQKDAK